MLVVFVLPLAIAVAGTIFFLFFTEMRLHWKLLALGITVASILIQFVPPLRVHFIVPFLMQAAVAFWVLLYWKLN